MDSLSNLQTFVQVAELRSFAEAGRSNGLSAAAIGKTISRLEDALAVRLFHRTTRSVSLTAEGELLLLRARRILAEAEAARADLSLQAGVPRGRLRVSLPLISDLALPMLADFMAAYPDVALDLELTDRVVDVVEEGFDVVLRVGTPADSRLSARRVGRFNRCVVASPAYLAAHGTPRVPEDLLQHRCLHYRFPSSGRIEQWPLRGLPTSTELPQSMVCNTIETRLCFAIRGQGIAYLPDHSVRSAVASGQLQRVLDDYVDAPGELHLLWPSGRHVVPRVRVFIDFVAARLMQADPHAASAALSC